MEKIRVGILGYGNLGRGVEMAITQNPDMELVGVFTRRDPATVTIRLQSRAFPFAPLPIWKLALTVSMS